MDKGGRHIAMMISALRMGGSERVLVNLAEYFLNQGWKVTMVTQYRAQEEYSLDKRAKRIISDIEGNEITGNRLIDFLRRFQKLRMIWKREKPDVILSFIGKNNIMAILTSRFLRIPVAVSVRGDPLEEYYNSVLRVCARFLFAEADGVILQTKRCMDFFPAKVRKRAVILRNPVNTAFFRERYAQEREKIIVSVGRIDVNKNHEMLVKAFAAIAGEFPEYKLIIYGDGECRSRLAKQAVELGVKESVLFPGSIRHVEDAIYKARVFVLPSNTEGVPNTLIEAMLMGLTVISTDCPCGGPAALIKNGVNGVLTPVGDAQSMQENLRMVLSDSEMADRLGATAAEIAEDYQPENVYGSWKLFLESLIARK